MLNGERLPGLLMTIIRFVLPSNDHTLKKLLLIFWEIWPKTSPDGKLLHEMILVCDAYRKVSLVSSCWERVWSNELPLSLSQDHRIILCVPMYVHIPRCVAGYSYMQLHSNIIICYNGVGTNFGWGGGGARCIRRGRPKSITNTIMYAAACVFWVICYSTNN